ncbi:MAG: hypothetical protein R3Y13_02830 [bacterium]
MIKENLNNIKKKLLICKKQILLHYNYGEIDATMIAKDNNIEYLEEVKSKTNHNKKYENSCYLYDGKYMLLYPANDGMPTCPIVWYNEKKDKIMDNQFSFENITNLDDIILKMINLYENYIDDNVFIASNSFAIKLTDEIVPNYIGKASLVLTKDSIRNNKVKKEQLLEAKKYFINGFLDQFLGWNFGIIIENNSQLENKILEFNELVISKGLREDFSMGLDVWSSEKVKGYELKRTK